jgi:hypothetical protein
VTRVAGTRDEARIFVRVAMKSGGEFVCVVEPAARDADLTSSDLAVTQVRTQIANGDLLKGVWADSDHRFQVTPLERACARVARGETLRVEWLSLSAVASIGTLDYTPRT